MTLLLRRFPSIAPWPHSGGRTALADRSLRNISRWLVGSCFIVLAFLPFASDAAGAGKVVWELEVEKIPQVDLVAATALQGIGNREEPRVFLQTGARSWITNLKHPLVRHSPEVLARYRGVDDVWKEYYSKKYGFDFQTVSSLNDLVEKVQDKVKGVVLYNERNAGQVAAAVTFAGIRDAVPATADLLKRTPALQKLLVLEDLRSGFDDSLSPQQHAIDKYLPECSRGGAFSYRPGNDAVSLDVAVAQRQFVYNLSHLLPDSPVPAKERAKLAAKPGGLTPPDGPMVQKILAHLDPISPVWGWGEPLEEVFLKTVSQAGAFVMCAQVPNISFHAKVPVPKDPLRQSHVKPEDVVVEPKFYIAFMVNEGDTMKCAGSMMLNGSWLEPERGSLPINWGISPYICEKFPGMMSYFYETMSPNDYFFDGPAGYAYIKPNDFPKDLLFPFAEKTRQANLVADTRFAECWYFYNLTPPDLRTKWLAAMGLEGMTQWRGPQQVRFSKDAHPIIDSPNYYSKKTTEELAAQLREEASRAPRPWFTIVYAGTPHKFAELAKLLPADQFKIVRLDELFIAAQKSRASIEGKILKPAPTPTPTPKPERKS